VACTQSNAFNVAEPFDVITWAVTRALEMLNNTIRELVNARKAVCAGATPAWPLLGDVTLDWLRNRLGVCVDDIQVWTAGTFVNRSVAEVIRRLVRVRNLIGSNGLRYACGSPDCETNDWAFVRARDAAGNCLPGTPQMLIRLCRGFWVPAVRADGKPVPPEIHREFQAQTIIHEASHLTHCNAPERRGHTIGVAECLAQFVAATNGSPLDPTFETSCTRTNQCAVAAAARPGVGQGFAGPGSIRINRTIFRPENAIRLKGRPAMRRGLKSKAITSRERESLTGNLGQPATIENQFHACWDPQKRAIQATFNDALTFVRLATATLGTVYGRPASMTQRTRQLLNKHFHTTERDNILKIFRNFFRIKQAFEQGLKFECQINCKSNPQQRDCGYAWATQWFYSSFGRYKYVHLCFDNRPNHCSFTNLTAQQRAALIIHEAAHRHAGIDDKVYAWEQPPRSSRDYSKLTSKQAMDNADSYAWFAVEL